MIDSTAIAKQIPEENCYGAIHSLTSIDVWGRAWHGKGFLRSAEKFVRGCMDSNLTCFYFIRYNGQLTFIRRKP